MADLLFRELSEKEDTVVGGKDDDSEISKELSASVDSTVVPSEEGTGKWIVSTKTRRLAPAFTLSRKDLGVQELAASKKRGTCNIDSLECDHKDQFISSSIVFTVAFSMA